ncbi:unnamed protein product [marine sediment metagenome]|uniref:Uncharacterized protein n=1 Tax=marine sediment metagenome TaxID=412755 RepID=X1HSY4_9ZZZZ
MEIPKADEVRKNMRRIDEYVLPSGGRYGMYSDGKVFVGIHEDDDEIVTIFDIEKGKCVYMDEKTIMGWKVFEEMLKGGRL